MSKGFRGGDKCVLASMESAQTNSSLAIHVPEIVEKSPVPPPEYLRILREEVDPMGTAIGKYVQEIIEQYFRMNQPAQGPRQRYLNAITDFPYCDIVVSKTS
jgi:hypothetical protein